MRTPSPGWSSPYGVRCADPRADRPDLGLHRSSRWPQELRRAAGGGDRPPGQGPTFGRPVRVPQQARGQAEDPGRAGRRIRPLPPTAGTGDVRLPSRRRRRGASYGDRIGDDPWQHRPGVSEVTTPVRAHGRWMTLQDSAPRAEPTRGMARIGGMTPGRSPDTDLATL